MAAKRRLLSSNPPKTIIYREYHLNPDFPVFLMPAQPDSPLKLSFHFHNCIELAYYRHGAAECNIEGKLYFCKDGDTLLIPPFSTHTSRIPAPSPDDEIYYIYMDPERLLQPFYPYGLSAALCWYRSHTATSLFCAKDFPPLAPLVSRLVKELASPCESSRLLVRGLVQAMLTDLSRAFPAMEQTAVVPSSMEKILPALEFINHSYAAEVSTDHLASLCYISREHFRKEFVKALHQTPSQYIKAVRIQKACGLLAETEDSITDIALLAGFGSLSSFYDTFRAYMRTTPGNFRNSQRLYQKKDLNHLPYTPFDQEISHVPDKR